LQRFQFGSNPVPELNRQFGIVANTMDDALWRFSQKKGIFRSQKMSKSAKAKVDDLLSWESHLLREQKIHMIRAAMKALVSGAEKVSTTKCRQFQVHLNRV
jgi:hypothetical protein